LPGAVPCGLIYALVGLVAVALPATAAGLHAPGTKATDTSPANAPGGAAKKKVPIVFRADQVEYDDKRALTIAKGHVEISQGNEILLADTVTYDAHTDTVTASGKVSLLEPTGDILFASFLELQDQFNNGFGKNVRMLLSDRSRLAANTARLTNGNRIDLRRSVYSPCDLCSSDPSQPPAWQLKAEQINDDRQLKIVEFRDATMELDGFPIFYTPYISEPDPSVKRASGFLSPSFGGGGDVGEHISIPYYWVLGPDKDLTLDPRFTTQAGEVLAGEYRERFSDGELDALGSINYSNVGAGTDENLGDALRGNINASGVWDIDSTYRTGFQLQRVSDQTYLLRFGFDTPLLNSEISHAYLQGFDPTGGTDVDAYLFQPLTPGLGDATQPIVLPVINRDWQSQPDALGGRWNINANLLDIVREVGTQTRRASVGSVWNTTLRDGIGGQYELSASVRADGYSVDDLSQASNPDLPNEYFSINGAPPLKPIGDSLIAGRVFPQLGLKWSYPLIRRGDELTELVEPIVGVYAGPDGGNRTDIPDEDSQSFQFRDSNLFEPDRLAGYDVLDTGQRVDYGTKFGLYDKDGGSYHMLIGQSLRAQTNAFLPPDSGAEQRVSDIVGGVTLAPNPYLDLVYHFRLDSATLASHYQEIGVSAGPQNLRLGVNYLLIPAQQQSDVVTDPIDGATENIIYGKREQLIFSANTKLTRYWSLNGQETVNLTDSANIVNGVTTPQSSSTNLYATLSAIYQDECMAFIGSITQSGIRSGDVTPGVSVLFSIVFKNLGEIGGNVLSVGGSTTTTDTPN
jgi:LPS-assembly protein